jgi:hypothetical protein
MKDSRMDCWKRDGVFGEWWASGWAGIEENRIGRVGIFWNAVRIRLLPEVPRPRARGLVFEVTPDFWGLAVRIFTVRLEASGIRHTEKRFRRGKVQ